MEGEIIDIDNTEGRYIRGIYYGDQNMQGRVVIAQTGLGGTIESSGFISDIRDAAQKGGNFSLLAVDHPGHGINKDDKNTPYTLIDCQAYTQAALAHILGDTDIRHIIMASNSLGFWSMFQALARMNDNKRILGLLGKSGIVSYRTILSQILRPLGGDTNRVGALEKLKLAMKTGPDGWGAMQINPGDAPVPIHASLLDQIETLDEHRSIASHLEVWHAERDGFTSLGEMKGHNGGELIIHVQSGANHGLSVAGDDSVSRRVNQEMIHRIHEIFETFS